MPEEVLTTTAQRIERVSGVSLSVAVPVLVGLAAFVYFAWMATPDLTFANADQDLADTLWSTRVFGLQHPSGSPLYTTLGWLVTRGVTDWGVQAHLLAVELAALGRLRTV